MGVLVFIWRCRCSHLSTRSSRRAVSAHRLRDILGVAASGAPEGDVAVKIPDGLDAAREWCSAGEVGSGPNGPRREEVVRRRRRLAQFAGAVRSHSGRRGEARR